MDEKHGRPLLSYICVWVDDMLIASKNPKAITDMLSEEYTLKGVGPLEYYLGVDVARIDEPEKVFTMGSGTYIDKCLTIYKQFFGGLSQIKSIHHWTPRITLSWTSLLSWIKQVYTFIGSSLACYHGQSPWVDLTSCVQP